MSVDWVLYAIMETGTKSYKVCVLTCDVFDELKGAYDLHFW